MTCQPHAPTALPPEPVWTIKKNEKNVMPLPIFETGTVKFVVCSWTNYFKKGKQTDPINNGKKYLIWI